MDKMKGIPEKVTIETCGIIMPISSIDNCDEQHWSEVMGIISDAIRDAGFEPNIVSNADDVGIIQKRIIQNLYENPIVICDVSGKNPNVMFELGMRLAFDKPTIIVKDDNTSYSFDTSPIEHLEYPRDLRFNKIVEFKKSLKEKIIGTINKSKKEANFSTFLQHFGKFTVAKLETTELSKDAFILEELMEIKRQISSIQYSRRTNYYQEKSNKSNTSNYKDHDCSKDLSVVINLALSAMKNDNALKSKINSVSAVIDYCDRMNILPDCFDVNSDSCREIMEKEILNTLNFERKFKNTKLSMMVP